MQYNVFSQGRKGKIAHRRASLGTLFERDTFLLQNAPQAVKTNLPEKLNNFHVWPKIVKDYDHDRDKYRTAHCGDIMNKDSAIDASARVYSSKITATYVKFLRKEYGYVDIEDLLSYAGMETYQVEDEAYWFTQEQVDLFNERLVKVTGNSDITREAGRFGFSPDSLGFVKSYILGCMSIGKAFEMAAKIIPKFAKSCTYESARLGPNKAKVVVRPRPGAQEKPYQCRNRTGYFEAAGTLFHHKFPQIEHTKCVFKGDECCEYVVTWREFKYEMWKKVRNFGGASLLAIVIAISYWNFSVGLISTMAVLAGLLAFSTLVWRLERKELYAGIDNLSRSTDEVVKKMETSRTHMDFTRQIIVALSLERDREGMMEQITSLFEKEPRLRPRHDLSRQ